MYTFVVLFLCEICSVSGKIVATQPQNVYIQNFYRRFIITIIKATISYVILFLYEKINC